MDFPGLLGAASPAFLCQSYFILAASGVLAVAALPAATRRGILDYGARDSRTAVARAEAADDRSGLDQLVGQLTGLGKVPHSWFATFYVVYISFAAFWAVQYIQDGRLLGGIASRQAATASRPSMPLGQVWIASTLMWLQATRRLYEHLVVIRASRSKMWFVHWLLGLSFYIVMSISVWIEASGK